MHIMNNTVQNNCGLLLFGRHKREWEKGSSMDEKIYKTMYGAGALNIIIGVVAIAAGIAGGVLLLISGGKLIAGKSRIMF